ncbi:hypothetical protein COTS27_00811 [Spirochaetota bacterium]|nr:hypothetical protein COTS27_00811 [Spirochaetota bacterium]
MLNLETPNIRGAISRIGNGNHSPLITQSPQKIQPPNNPATQQSNHLTIDPPKNPTTPIIQPPQKIIT